MNVRIAELRPQDVDAVHAMFAGGQPLDELASPMGLSLLAREGEAILAAIVCTRGEDGYLYRMARREGFSDPALERQLLDKALLKLSGQRIHKCRINVDETFLADALWHGHDETEVEVDPVVVTSFDTLVAA